MKEILPSEINSAAGEPENIEHTMFKTHFATD